MNTDPRAIISGGRMTPLQVLTVVLTIGLNGLDGFDVLSISFASPGIASEWGINRAALGIVLSMELIGMAIGSLLLGGVADRIGRRPTILACLVLMAAGMLMATTVHGVYDLSFWRIVTGLGIGGMLASINAAAAEFSNFKRRHLCVSMMAIGYPIGAVLGGIVAAEMLKTHSWRAVFFFGGFVTLAFIPLVYFFVPETVHWLTRKQPANALEKINRTLARMGHPVVAALPSICAAARKRAWSDILTPAFIGTTLVVAAGYFFHIITFYFVLKWIPKIVADFGFAPSSAGYVLVWSNVGGAIGGAVLGLLTLRFSVKRLTIAAMLLSTVFTIIFGRTAPDLQQLSLMCAVAGLFTNASVVGMYALFAQAFPTHVRASGTGFAIGIGRGGSVLAPIVAGFLFQAGNGLPRVAGIMACGSLIGAIVLSFLQLRADHPSADTEGESAAQPPLRGAPTPS